MKYAVIGMTVFAASLAYFICVRPSPYAVHESAERQGRDADGQSRSPPRSSQNRPLPHGLDELKALFAVPGEPQPGDWLDEHDEPGETYRQYLAAQPTTPRGKRRLIHIQPLGGFTPSQERIVKATAEFLKLYFQLPIRVRPAWPESVVPADARRRHPESGTEQILTGYVLDELMMPELPDDAAAMLVLTATDLWPGKGWNFVFGEASTRDRVGVWSLNRFGNPDDGPAAYRLCLLRTLGTATHETGHMFSMQHCTMYECNMAGSNNLEESDRGPLALCPECLAKLCKATRCDPVKRYRDLIVFCDRHKLTEESRFYERCLQALASE